MDFIASHDELRSIYKPANDGSIRKELKKLDHHCRAFIARSPFVLIGSSDGKGNADVTPKGDKPGFAAVLDDNHRHPRPSRQQPAGHAGEHRRQPGRRPALPHPGHERDAARQRRGEDHHRRGAARAAGGRGQAADQRYMHCAKAFMRSELWQPESWPERSSMPTLGEILRDQMAVDQSAAETDRRLDEVYKQTLW